MTIDDPNDPRAFLSPPQKRKRKKEKELSSGRPIFTVCPCMPIVQFNYLHERIRNILRNRKHITEIT